ERSAQTCHDEHRDNPSPRGKLFPNPKGARKISNHRLVRNTSLASLHYGQQNAFASDDDEQKEFPARVSGDLSPAERYCRRHANERAGGAELIQKNDLRTLLTDGEQGFLFYEPEPIQFDPRF